jgi:UDP:flavonoid glycosyltransferase YjiC (YdhE family)
VLPLRPRASDSPFPWERLPADGRPCILVCFGSHLSPPVETYPAICASLGPDEAFFVCVLKDLCNDPAIAELGPHTLTAAFAPQLELLDRCAVMVHHGGASSVMECMSRGVPMIVVPLGYDQHVLGRAVERAGLGIVVEPAAVTPDVMRRALLDLLARPSPVVAIDGGQRACELVEALSR